MIKKVNGFFKWPAALEKCKELGGHIFEPHSKEEANEIPNWSFESTYIWTGINDIAKNGE